MLCVCVCYSLLTKVENWALSWYWELATIELHIWRSLRLTTVRFVCERAIGCNLLDFLCVFEVTVYDNNHISLSKTKHYMTTWTTQPKMNVNIVQLNQLNKQNQTEKKSAKRHRSKDRMAMINKCNDFFILITIGMHWLENIMYAFDTYQVLMRCGCSTLENRLK